LTQKSLLPEGPAIATTTASDDSNRRRHECPRFRPASAQGFPAEILIEALRGERVQLCVSADIYAEYEEVIRRPRFKRSEWEVDGALRAIREQALWVKPSQRIRACSDPDDDIFLECAQAAKAHFLVTGNLKHFPSSWADTKIVTARQLVDVLAHFK